MPKTQETKFVNSLFLTNLIQTQYGETEVKIKTYDVEPATAEINDPYARSSMNRILVKYVSKENPSENVITFVAKIKPSEGNLVEEFKKSDVFDKEIIIYKNILPKLVAVISKLGGAVELAPQLIYSSDVPSNLMVLEDLTVRGYSVENQQLGLNLEQSKMAIEKMAFMHAASVVLLAESPADFARFAKGTFHADHKDKLGYFSNALATVAESASELGINSAVAGKLKTLPAKAIQKAIDAYGSDFQGLKVLNHGDFWTNNVMYKYNNNELIDAIFVDFQNCVVGSPIIDLVYFLTSSPSYEVLEQSRDELIYVYHETLSLLLQRLDYKKSIPSLVDLQVELLKHGALEVILSLTTAPFLRTKNAQNTPAMQPTLYKDEQKVDLKPVLKAHAGQINQQLKDYELRGLLDWGAAESKIKGLMGRFQK
ncbi:Juvenile hormone-inducible protein [Culex quinquefasciatus]|uniref:Juvenile hormone-inducible protein n=1 Tax=Culex quinquefasciatus TaxID=7176 RepID=B0WT26_CULQU|nr:Juvenile hormone-inducible protein [Culex quinquefasciatus]|eukprot:XP_001870788.1 Juvenile hormone-inducible protein [Culex quinquefasciatus]